MITLEGKVHSRYAKGGGFSPPLPQANPVRPDRQLIEDGSADSARFEIDLLRLDARPERKCRAICDAGPN